MHRSTERAISSIEQAKIRENFLNSARRGQEYLPTLPCENQWRFKRIFLFSGCLLVPPFGPEITSHGHHFPISCPVAIADSSAALLFDQSHFLHLHTKLKRHQGGYFAITLILPTYMWCLPILSLCVYFPALITHYICGVGFGFYQLQ